MENVLTKTPWLASFSKQEDCERRLFCFPYAGAGAQTFAQWQSYVPNNTEVIGVSLPGREAHFGKRAYDDWDSLLTALTQQILPALDKPYAFFGHSLGARICYELTHVLTAHNCRLPEHLFVSACRAPGVAPLVAPMHTMTFDELMARLREMGGVPEEVLQDRRIMEMLEPTLRADLKLAEIWQGTMNPIPVSITAMNGEYDDIDPYHAMAPWGEVSSCSFSNNSFPGGHFFLHEHTEQVLTLMNEKMGNISEAIPIACN